MYLNLLILLELFIIIARAISGTAYEDHENTFENEEKVVAIIEIGLYIIGSISAVLCYWYTYLYFRRSIRSAVSDKQYIDQNLYPDDENMSRGYLTE
jgi:hypothetical protein